MHSTATENVRKKLELWAGPDLRGTVLKEILMVFGKHLMGMTRPSMQQCGEWAVHLHVRQECEDTVRARQYRRLFPYVSRRNPRRLD